MPFARTEPECRASEEQSTPRGRDCLARGQSPSSQGPSLQARTEWLLRDVLLRDGVQTRRLPGRPLAGCVEATDRGGIAAHERPEAALSRSSATVTPSCSTCRAELGHRTHGAIERERRRLVVGIVAAVPRQPCADGVAALSVPHSMQERRVRAVRETTCTHLGASSRATHWPFGWFGASDPGVCD